MNNIDWINLSRCLKKLPSKNKKNSKNLKCSPGTSFLIDWMFSKNYFLRESAFKDFEGKKR